MDTMSDDAVNLTPRETDILAARLIAKHIVNDSPAVVLWEDVPELSEQASGCSNRTPLCIPTRSRLKGEPVADQTPDPIDVIAGWLWLDDMDGLMGESARSASGELLDALTAAGLRIVPVVDDATRQEVAALVAQLTPKICPFCKGVGWVDDEGWSDERWSRGQIEREEGEGLIPCGACGDWHTYRDEYTEPTTIVDGWTREQESRSAELLAAAYLGRTDG